MDRLRVGFIGAGRIADLHALGYDGNADAELYAVCDADGEWAARRAQEWGAERSFTDYRELLSDPKVDAVEVLTPHRFHAEMSVAALADDSVVIGPGRTARSAGKIREFRLRNSASPGRSFSSVRTSFPSA